MTFEQTLERSEGLSRVAIWVRRVSSRGKSSEPEGGEAEGACLGHLWEGSGSGWSSKSEQRRMSGKEVGKVLVVLWQSHLSPVCTEQHSKLAWKLLYAVYSKILA